MAYEKALELRAVKWSEDASKVLGQIYAQDADALECVKQDVNSACATLWEVHAEGVACGFIVTRLDIFSTGAKEFVIVSAVATVKGVDLFSKCLPVFEKRAKLAGCIGVRYHATRKFKAFEQKAEKAGYFKKEVVYYKGVS